MKGNLIVRDEKKYRTIIDEIIKRDLNFNSSNVNMIYDKIL